MTNCVTRTLQFAVVVAIAAVLLVCAPILAAPTPPVQTTPVLSVGPGEVGTRDLVDIPSGAAITVPAEWFWSDNAGYFVANEPYYQDVVVYFGRTGNQALAEGSLEDLFSSLLDSYSGDLLFVDYVVLGSGSVRLTCIAVITQVGDIPVALVAYRNPNAERNGILVVQLNPHRLTEATALAESVLSSLRSYP